MDLNKIRERLSLIEQDLAQIQANFNLLEGAKRECLHWIKDLEGEKNEKIEENDTSSDGS